MGKYVWTKVIGKFAWKRTRKEHTFVNFSVFHIFPKKGKSILSWIFQFFIFFLKQGKSIFSWIFQFFIFFLKQGKNIFWWVFQFFHIFPKTYDSNIVPKTIRKSLAIFTMYVLMIFPRKVGIYFYNCLFSMRSSIFLYLKSIHFLLVFWDFILF